MCEQGTIKDFHQGNNKCAVRTGQMEAPANHMGENPPNKKIIKEKYLSARGKSDIENFIDYFFPNHP